MVSLPDYNDNPFANGSATRRLPEAAQGPEQAAAQLRHPGPVPAGLDLQAGRRRRCVRRTARSRRRRGSQTQAFLSIGNTATTTGTTPASATHDLRRLRPLVATLLLPAGRHARHRPAVVLGARMGLRRQDRHRPAERGIRDRASNAWKERVFNGQPIYPGETYQAGIGQGYDMMTPLQLIDAYSALANGGKLYRPQIVRRVLDPDGKVVQDFKPDLIRTLPISQDTLRTMRVAARNVPVVTPYLQPGGSPGGDGRQVRNGRVRSARQAGPSAVPLVVRGLHAEGLAKHPRGSERVRGGQGNRQPARIPGLRVRLANRGNAATEIVKYFVQLYYHTGVDLRINSLLTVDNHYGN